jgi:hypothetical protein
MFLVTRGTFLWYWRRNILANGLLNVCSGLIAEMTVPELIEWTPTEASNKPLHHFSCCLSVLLALALLVSTAALSFLLFAGFAILLPIRSW